MICGTRTRRLALLALAFTGAAIICARTFFVVRILRIVGLVTIATVFAVAFVATGFFVLMVPVRFAGEVRAALALMQTAIIAASASFIEFMTIASVGRFVARSAAPLAANTLATATRAANAIDVFHRNVIVKAVVERRALNPLDEVDNAAFVRIVSLEIIESCDV